MKKTVNPVKSSKTGISPTAKLFNRVKYLNLGIDLDGVIIDHTQNKIRLAREFGFDIKPEQTPGHRLKKIVGEEYYQKIRSPLYGPITEFAPPMGGALNHLSRLVANNYKLFIISARGKKDQSQVCGWDWVDHHLLDILDKQQILFVEQEKQKNLVCQKLKIDVYLDDKVDVLKSLTYVSKLYLFDPYQIRHDYHDLKNIQPVSSWSEFFDQIKKQSG